MASAAGLKRDIARLRADAARYREAAGAALDDLDWVIAHLEENRRIGLARDLRRNRTSILGALGEDPRRR